MGLRQRLLETTRRVGDQGNDTQAILLVSGCGGKHRTREDFPMVQMTSVKEKEGCEGGTGQERGLKASQGTQSLSWDSWVLCAEWDWPRCIV